MRKAMLVALSVLAALALSGCGGGGNAGLTGDTGQPISFGALSGRAAKTNPPVLTNAAGVSAIGLTGAVQSLELRDVSKDLAATKIAFTANRDGNNQVYSMNAEGSNPQNLSRNGSQDSSPSWSPDGTRIAFVSDRDGNQEIYVMNADGSNQQNLTRNAGEDIDPTWSPDGTKIAFVSFRDSNFEVYVMNADGSNQHDLTNNPSGDFVPAWSPDGTKIAFQTNRDGNPEIYVMNADGSNLTRLTNSASGDGAPAWSPDGTKLAFQTDRDGNEEIYMMNVDGSNQHNLTSNASGDFNPSWSPDGTKIAFDSNRDGGNEIYKMDADGSNQIRPTKNPLGDTEPSWSPFPSRRKLIGTGGQMGASAAGFVFAQSGDAFPTSIVTFNAASFTSLLLTAPTGNNNTGATLVYDLEGSDSAITLADLRYWNLTDLAPVQVLPASGLTAKGALITFGAKTGLVRSILPFSAPGRAAKGRQRPQVTVENGDRVARGQFLGVWNDQGKNLAPHGAQEVRLDGQTGGILSVR